METALEESDLRQEHILNMQLITVIHDALDNFAGGLPLVIKGETTV